MAYSYNCTCAYMNRDHKTFYIRRSEKVDGKLKAKWIPVGVVCLGCQTVEFTKAR